MASEFVCNIVSGTCIRLLTHLFKKVYEYNVTYIVHPLSRRIPITHVCYPFHHSFSYRQHLCSATFTTQCALIRYTIVTHMYNAQRYPMAVDVHITCHNR